MKALLLEFAASLDLQAMFFVAVFVIGAVAIWRVVRADNPVEAWHFIASGDGAGKQWGDPKKLAVIVFIFSSTVFVGYTFWAHAVDNLYIVALFFGWAIAMLGIDVFSSWARSFVDRRFGQGEQPKAPGDKP